MDFCFKQFQRENYQECASWFTDAELNKRLGPMDDEWLSAILARTEEEGITWAVYLGAEMVGVVETVFDPEKVLPVGITALAVKPVLRRQGIGSAILRELLVSHNRLGIREHCVFIHMSNEAAHQLFERQGFVQVSEPDKHGYIEYRHCCS
jgi:ribosomal protein S18 acetylase RimI-like enzyme